MEKMSDLIERQTAIDAVEESRRQNHHKSGKEACCHEYEHRHFIKILTDLPSAQPEIIRCKDCKHWDKTWTNNWSPDYHYCPVMDEVRKGNLYCRYAERRTDE